MPTGSRKSSPVRRSRDGDPSPQFSARCGLGSHVRRRVFFVSDSTGITVETLGNALLSQFDHVEFETTTIPFVTDASHADEVVARDQRDGKRRA